MHYQCVSNHEADEFCIGKNNSDYEDPINTEHAPQPLRELLQLYAELTWGDYKTYISYFENIENLINKFSRNHGVKSKPLEDILIHYPDLISHHVMVEYVRQESVDLRRSRQIAAMVDNYIDLEIYYQCPDQKQAAYYKNRKNSANAPNPLKELLEIYFNYKSCKPSAAHGYFMKEIHEFSKNEGTHSKTAARILYEYPILKNYEILANRAIKECNWKKVVEQPKGWEEIIRRGVMKVVETVRKGEKEIEKVVHDTGKVVQGKGQETVQEGKHKVGKVIDKVHKVAHGMQEAVHLQSNKMKESIGNQNNKIVNGAISNMIKRGITNNKVKVRRDITNQRIGG